MDQQQAEHEAPQSAADDLDLDSETLTDLEAQEPEASDIHGGQAGLASGKVWCSDARLKRDVVRLSGSLARLCAIA